MGASLLITLREGLEISLVLAIIVGYLEKSGLTGYFHQIWLGGLLAVAACVVSGIAFHFAVGEFQGKSEQFIEGTLAFSAVAVLTWMIFWMRAHARGMKGDLQDKLQTALDKSPWALAVVAFVAVAREGFETVLFLIGAENEGTSGAQIVVGGLIGLVIAAALGVAIYRGGRRVDLGKFFTWTGALLLLFAAGLFAKGVHEFREFFEIDSSLIAKPAWTVASGPFSEGHSVHDFLNGLFGWSPSPERIRVVAYLAYLLPIGWLYLRDIAQRPGASSAVPTADSTKSPVPQT
jgi:high-affinity iron transporter